MNIVYTNKAIDNDCKEANCECNNDTKFHCCIDEGEKSFVIFNNNY